MVGNDRIVKILKTESFPGALYQNQCHKRSFTPFLRKNPIDW